jgi:hypothetical protein
MHCGLWPSRPLPLKYEIVAVGQSGVYEAADRLLAHAHGDRRMLRQAGAQLRHAGVEVGRLDDLTDEAGGKTRIARRCDRCCARVPHRVVSIRLEMK